MVKLVIKFKFRSQAPKFDIKKLKFIFSNVCDDIFSHIVDLRCDLVCGIDDADILLRDIVDLAHALIYHIDAFALLSDALAHLVDTLSQYVCISFDFTERFLCSFG